MNKQNILKIVSSDNQFWEKMLLIELSKDEDVIPSILEMLNTERDNKNILIKDMNVLLSQSDTIIENPKLNKSNFFQDKISEFYKKYSNYVTHCFKK